MTSRFFIPFLLILPHAALIASEFKPVIIETAAAKAYVVPPLMRWSENQKTIASIDADRGKSWKPVFLFGYPREQATYRSSDLLRLDDKEKDVAVQSFMQEAIARGASLSNSRNNYATLTPVRIGKDELPVLKAAQHEAFLAWAKEADPMTGRRITAKEAGTWAALAGVSLVVGVLTGGVDISSTFGSQMGNARRGPTVGFAAKDGDGVPKDYPLGAMMPYQLELDGYERVDYRGFVIAGDNSMRTHGEIIIAYRGEKTVEAENEILPLAWLAATGLSLTEEQILEARESERLYRVKVWDACVASGECK